MKLTNSCAAITLAVALGGCSLSEYQQTGMHEEGGANILSKSLDSALDKCGPNNAPANSKHTIVMKLPERLGLASNDPNFPQLTRDVTLFVNNTATGVPNCRANSICREPFHILLDKNIVSDNGYLLVKVLLNERLGANFTAATNGISRKDPGKSSLCGSSLNNNGREAHFYINLSRFFRTEAPNKGNSVDFNIMLTPIDFPETKIIIDPAVRNEG